MGARPRPIVSAARVVLDTSVIVSALVFEAGRLAWLDDDGTADLRDVLTLVRATESFGEISKSRFSDFGNILTVLSARRRHDGHSQVSDVTLDVNNETRLCFRYEGGDARDVEIVDYHH